MHKTTTKYYVNVSTNVLNLWRQMDKFLNCFIIPFSSVWHLLFLVFCVIIYANKKGGGLDGNEIAKDEMATILSQTKTIINMGIKKWAHYAL